MDSQSRTGPLPATLGCMNKQRMRFSLARGHSVSWTPVSRCVAPWLLICPPLSDHRLLGGAPELPLGSQGRTFLQAPAKLCLWANELGKMAGSTLCHPHFLRLQEFRAFSMANSLNWRFKILPSRTFPVCSVEKDKTACSKDPPQSSHLRFLLLAELHPGENWVVPASS